jgi:hypothetical protein
MEADGHSASAPWPPLTAGVCAVHAVMLGSANLLSSRTRGVALPRVVDDRRQSREGWDASFRAAAGPSTFQALDS